MLKNKVVRALLKTKVAKNRQKQFWLHLVFHSTTYYLFILVLIDTFMVPYCNVFGKIMIFKNHVRTLHFQMVLFGTHLVSIKHQKSTIVNAQIALFGANKCKLYKHFIWEAMDPKKI